jgi:hypothetical protein
MSFILPMIAFSCIIFLSKHKVVVLKVCFRCICVVFVIKCFIIFLSTIYYSRGFQHKLGCKTIIRFPDIVNQHEPFLFVWLVQKFLIGHAAMAI